MSLTILVITVITCILIEGLFSGSEIALISSDKLELRKQANKGSAGAKLALNLLKRPEKILATTLVGNNICIAFQGAAASIFLYLNYGKEFEYLSVLILTPLVLIFGEILPKTFYQRHSDFFAPKVAPIINAFYFIFAPLTWSLGKYTAFISKKLQPLEELLTGRHKPTHRDELRYLLNYGQKETALKSSERKMIRKIFDFSKASAKNALIPLVKVDMIEDNITCEEAVKFFNKFVHSRLPVYNKRVDNIVGILHVFDVFLEPNQKKSVQSVMRPAYYAPEIQKLDELLFTMQKQGLQMSILVDEYGGAVGVITLEDIIEEIVGDIKDEYDSDSEEFQRISENEFIIKGRSEITAINDVLKLGLPKGDYETLAGFLMLQFNRIPEQGDELYYNNLKIVIRKASKKTIDLVYIQITHVV